MGTATTSIDWLRISASMLLVLGLLAALMWTLKRMKGLQIQHKGPPMMQVLETISVGPRQKMALVRVGAHQVLVGMTASQFTALGQWEDPGPQQEPVREK